MNDYGHIREALKMGKDFNLLSVTVPMLELNELITEIDTLRKRTVAPKEGKRYVYSHEFLAAWELYPRKQDVNKQAAYKAWCARLRAGVAPEAMTEGVKRYAAHCKAHGKLQHHILLPATFYGPDEHYNTAWSLPDKKERMRRLMAESWHRTSDGITAKAAELGIQPRAGESWDDLKKRIINKLNESE